jgi:hypothetical protein
VLFPLGYFLEFAMRLFLAQTELAQALIVRAGLAMEWAADPRTTGAWMADTREVGVWMADTKVVGAWMVDTGLAETRMIQS